MLNTDFVNLVLTIPENYPIWTTNITYLKIYTSSNAYYVKNL